MSGMWKRSHGRTSEAPPDERGGYRYVRPTATAPHLDSTKGVPLSPARNGQVGSISITGRQGSSSSSTSGPIRWFNDRTAATKCTKTLKLDSPESEEYVASVGLI